MISARRFGYIGIALLALWGAACANREPRQQERLTLRIGVPVPPVQTPGAGLSNVVSSLTSETLLGSAPDGRPIPRLADEWSWDSGRTHLRLHLHHQVLFHDGTPLTANVVVESLEHSIADKEGIGLSRIVAVRAVDNFTVEIILSQPDSFLLPELASVTIRLGRRDVGTGPFKLIRDSPEPVLEAFDEYYRGRPNIRQITLHPYPTQRSAWAALMRSEVDMLQEVSRDAIDFVESERAVRTYSFPKPYYYLLAFNLRNNTLRGREVRLAINEAVDKQALLNEGLHNRGRAASTPVWPEFWTVSSGTEVPAANPPAARARLDAAGFPKAPARPGVMPNRFTFTCLVFTGDNRLERTALLLQKQLYNVGIDMRLEPVSAQALYARASSGDFDAFLFEMANARTLTWVYNFWHSPRPDAPSFNFTGYTGADAVLDRIRNARSDEELGAETDKLQEVFHADPPAVFIAWQTQARAVSTKFDVVTEPNRDIMSTLWEWKLAAPDQLVSR